MTIRLAFTPGEPAGIGPDLCVRLAQLPQVAELVVYADPDLLLSRARQLGVPLTLLPFDSTSPPTPAEPGTLTIAPIPLAAPVTPGTLDVANSPYVIATLEAAINDCLAGHCAGLVTGPVHKGILNDAGIAFSGHTEFLAAYTATPTVVMMLVIPGLRVALATTHLPLRQVPQAITRESLAAVIHVLHAELRRRWRLLSPRIVVCGLNPHAGEGGHLGTEEIDTLIPVLNDLRAAGYALTGPLPADSLFTPKFLGRHDAVLAMYHDQGLSVLKYAGFGRAVNITLGLPFVRTSVDHGTALELAGTAQADINSLVAAIQQAVSMLAPEK